MLRRLFDNQNQTMSAAENFHDVMDIGDIEMTNQRDDSKGERSIVLLGTKHKKVFFQQLCESAQKYEKHVHYQDVHYLTIDHMGNDYIIELTDPGTARTGGREMAIRSADFALLYYSANSIESLHAIQSVSQALQQRKNMPILIVCDSDDITVDETLSANTSSSSEGYESDEREGMRRHYSMEQMRSNLEENAGEGGERLAEELGSRCSYLKIQASRKEDAQKVITQIIFTLQKSAPIKNRRKSIIKEILRNKSTDKNADAVFESGENSKKKKSKNGGDDSKVCSIM
ncbi:unnamed protein product [Caenorhabditis angaria]|uniref:Ras family protein n=1 Tax=Caenorhabditis angaria TaxID=860376 RepID=A0A9P1NB54_9PELO|nr:unnamed protein product [Caenorhabditis angaria]